MQKQIAKRLDEHGFRVETDLRNEKDRLQDPRGTDSEDPHMIIVGDKEAENGTVSVRTRAGGDEGSMQVEDFIAKLGEEVATRAK